jgi:hypothetical protein
VYPSIYGAVEKQDIVEDLADPLMPSRLKILGHKIYGKGVMHGLLGGF